MQDDQISVKNKHTTRALPFSIAYKILSEMTKKTYKQESSASWQETKEGCHSHDNIFRNTIKLEFTWDEIDES